MNDNLLKNLSDFDLVGFREVAETLSPLGIVTLIESVKKLDEAQENEPLMGLVIMQLKIALKK